jgi:two-component system, OmpR family, heavy metal sensor histidine kinase CusS
MKALESHSQKSPRPRSLALRLTLGYAGFCCLLLLVATGFLYYALHESLTEDDRHFLTERVSFLRGLLRDHPDDREELRREVQGIEAGLPNSRLLTRVLPNGNEPPLEASGMNQDLPVAVFPEPVDLDAPPGSGRAITTASGRSYQLVAARAALGRGADKITTIQLALDRTSEEHLLLSYWLARRGLRPLAQITAATQRVRASTLHERVPVADLPAELLVLGNKFNEMLDRLEDHVTRLGRFSADIAHEFRTPVNNLRGELEVAMSRARTPAEYHEVLGSCLEECDRLTRLVDTLLFLARAENPTTQIALERLNIRHELETVREFYGAAAEEKGVQLRAEPGEPLTAQLDRTLFQRAVGNLIANALTHTPAGGVVTLRAAEKAGSVAIEVADTGVGIPAAHLPYVFDRFYRADPARTSSSEHVGLGLAIVKSILSLHRGSVAIASQAGQGTCVTLSFPVTTPT